MFWKDWAGQLGLPKDGVGGQPIATFRPVRGCFLVSDSSRPFVEAVPPAPTPRSWLPSVHRGSVTRCCGQVLPNHQELGIPYERWDRCGQHALCVCMCV